MYVYVCVWILVKKIFFYTIELLEQLEDFECNSFFYSLAFWNGSSASGPWPTDAAPVSGLPLPSQQREFPTLHLRLFLGTRWPGLIHNNVVMFEKFVDEIKSCLSKIE